MGSFIDGLKAIEVRGSSPNNVAVVSTTMGTGYHVELRGPLDEYDEGSLAMEIEDAWKTAGEKYGEAVSRLVESRRGQVNQRGEPTDAEADLADELTFVEAAGGSARGFAKATIYGTGDLEIWIQPGVLRRLDVSTEILTAELDAAMAEAVAEYRSSIRSLRERFRNSPVRS